MSKNVSSESVLNGNRCLYIGDHTLKEPRTMNDIDGIYRLSNVSYVPITALCALLVMPHFIPLTTL